MEVHRDSSALSYAYERATSGYRFRATASRQSRVYVRCVCCSLSSATASASRLHHSSAFTATSFNAATSTSRIHQLQVIRSSRDSEGDRTP